MPPRRRRQVVASTRGITLDSGALIAAERNDRRFWTEWKRALLDDVEIRLPAIVVAQTWRDPRQATMASVIAACAAVDVTVPLARTAGRLLARTGGSDAVDAAVVAVASAHQDEVWCSDPRDIAALAEAATDGRGLAIRTF